MPSSNVLIKITIQINEVFGTIWTINVEATQKKMIFILERKPNIVYTNGCAINRTENLHLNKN